MITKERLLFITSLICVVVLTIPKPAGIVFSVLVGLFIFISIKKYPSSKSITNKSLLKGILTLFPMFLLFVLSVKGNVYVTIIVSILCFLIGSYFILTIENASEDITQSGDKDFRYTRSIIAFYLLFAFCTMLFCSQSSPLYSMNYWNDTNLYHTVTKSMLRGKVLYRDIHDQKGPMMFFSYIPSLLISQTGFFGMYIFESVLFFVYLLISIKTISLFRMINTEIVVLLPLFSLTIYTTNAFYLGGSAEEIMLPLSAYAIYIGLRAIINRRMFLPKEAIIIGVLSGITFWTKFTLCGLYLGFLIFVLIYSIKTKRIKELFRLILSYLIAFVATSIPVFIYFLANNSIKYLFSGYFYSNVFVYINARTSNNTMELSSDNVIIKQLSILVQNYDMNQLVALLIFIGIVFILHSKNKHLTTFLFTTLITSYIAIFGSGFMCSYYFLGLAHFSVLGVIPSISIINRTLNIIENKIIKRSILVYSVLIGAACLIIGTPSLFMINNNREDYPIYQFSDKINSIEDPKILNYGCIDTGIFMATDELPYNTHYCMLSDKEVYIQDQNDLIAEKSPDYIITMDYIYIWDGYRLCDTASIANRDPDGLIVFDTYFLYEKTDLD